MTTIKRLVSVITLCLLLAASAWATTIIIAPTTVGPSTTYPGSTCTLRIYSNATFVASDGQVVMAGTPGSGAFFKSVPCTIASGIISIPQFTLPSTTDALDVQTAKYTAIFYDSKGVKRDTYLADFPVPLSLGTSQTWGQIRLYKSGKQPMPDTTTYTRTQTDAQIQLALGTLNTANVGLLGRIETATAPADSVHPKAVLTEDPRIPTQAENDALAGTVGAPSSINKFVTNDDPRLTGGGGGGGTMTSFTANALNPLFTSSVANPNTTPVLSFTLSNTTQHTFFGRIASGTGVPSYVQPSISDLSDAANVPLLNNTSNKFTGYMGLQNTTPDPKVGLRINKTNVVPGVDTVDIGTSVVYGEGSANLGSGFYVLEGGYFEASSATTLNTGTGAHPTLIGVFGQTNFTGASPGRIDSAIGVQGVSFNGGGSGSNIQASYGGWFQAAHTGSALTGQAYGVYADVPFFGSSSASTYATVFQGRFKNFGSGTIPVVKGLDFELWGNTGGGTVTTSYGIFMDTSIDVGTTRWALYSTSTSPSLLSGDLTVSGLLKTGTTPTTLTDAGGKILSAALNVIQPAQGGTGTSTVFTPGSIVFAGTSGVYNQDNAALFFDNTNNRLGLNTVNPRTTLDVLNNSTAQLRLTFTDNSVFTDFSTGSGGTLTIAPTGNINFNTTGKQIDPTVNYSENFGQLSKKYLTGHFAELWSETLVAQNTLATIGGRILVGPTTQLIKDLAPSDTTIDVRYNNLASGDRAYMETNGAVEFMALTSGATIISGGFRYSVTRDLDSSGANQWFAGDAVFNTGTTGSGFIDLYSVRGVASASEVGPTIVGNIRNSATFNDWSEHWAIGNLNGLYGYGSNTPGIGLGEYEAGKTHITIDSTNGYRIFNGLSTVIGQWDASGIITVGQVAAGQDNILISAGALSIRNNTTTRINLAADGSGFLANNNIAWDTSGNLTVSGNATIAGWSVNSSSFAKDTGTNSTSSGMAPADFPFFAGATVANRSTAPFRVTPAGALTATNATITGAITATSGSFTGSITSTSGTIGGWTLSATSLTAGSGATTVGLDSGGTNPAFYAGSATPGSAPFRVTNAGALTATNATITGSITSTSGTIGGWTLGSTSLTSGSGSTTVGLDSGGSNPSFYAGSATPGSAPFRVTNAGALTATNATLTGSLSAASGNVLIDSNGIRINQSGTSFLQWQNSGASFADIGGQNFASGNGLLIIESSAISSGKSGQIQLEALNFNAASVTHLQLNNSASDATLSLFTGGSTPSPLGMLVGGDAVNAAMPASTIFELRSTTGAFLPTRMTTTQRDALTPTDGMMIYNTTTGAMNYRKAGAWVAF